MHKRIRIAAAASALLALTAFGALNSPVAHADSNTIPLPKADPLAVPPDHVIPNKPAYVILSAPAYQAVVLQSLAFSYGIAAPTGRGNNGDRVDLGQVTYYVDLDAYDHTVFWIFNATNVLGLYQVTSNLSGRCLDADNRFGGGNGTVVQTWDCLGGFQTNQLWWLTSDGSGHAQLVNDWSGRCLDVDNSRGGPVGSAVQLWDCLGDGQNKQTNQWYDLMRDEFLPRPINR
jgi:hypothetical protein